MTACLPFELTERVRRFQYPVLVLLALLQRTPIVRLLFGAEAAWVSPASGQLLRSSVVLALGAGAVDTLAGATTFTTNPVSPASATVGTTFSGAFAVTGAPSTTKSYTVTISTLPPGLAVSNAVVSGTRYLLNASSGLITGLPNTAGNYSVSITAWENLNASGNNTTYLYRINVTGPTATAPSITSQPSSQTVNALTTVTFSVVATGTAPLSYQWRKGGSNVSGATNANYSITSPTTSDSGTYSVVVSNSAGSATSNSATLTVNALAQTITFAALPDVPFSATPITLAAVASSTLPVSYNIVSGPASLSGSALALTGVGAVTVRASQSGNTIYAAASSVDRTFTVTNNFDAWSTGVFSASDLLNSEISGATADVDQDGLNNLMEYALGLDPKIVSATGLPAFSTTDTDWVLTYTRPTDRPDLTYAVEMSTGLNTWTTAGVTQNFVSSSNGVETWRGSVPRTSTALCFLRLKVTKN